MISASPREFFGGLVQDGHDSESFTDVRQLQRQVKELGINILTEVDESGSGPGSILIADPDGNPILIDQQR